MGNGTLRGTRTRHQRGKRLRPGDGTARAEPTLPSGDEHDQARTARPARNDEPAGGSSDALTRARSRRARIGISGYMYPRWRGVFYPDDIPQRRWLEYASRSFNSIELNGTFYSLKSPRIYESWATQVPDDFVFAVKGSRYITHNLKLRNARQ